MTENKQSDGAALCSGERHYRCSVSSMASSLRHDTTSPSEHSLDIKGLSPAKYLLRRKGICLKGLKDALKDVLSKNVDGDILLSSHLARFTMFTLLCPPRGGGNFTWKRPEAP